MDRDEATCLSDVASLLEQLVAAVQDLSVKQQRANELLANLVAGLTPFLQEVQP